MILTVSDPFHITVHVVILLYIVFSKSILAKSCFSCYVSPIPERNHLQNAC